MYVVMMLTVVKGEFCRRKSTIPSGMGGGCKPSLNALFNLAASSGDLVAALFNMVSSIKSINNP